MLVPVQRGFDVCRLGEYVKDCLWRDPPLRALMVEVGDVLPLPLSLGIEDEVQPVVVCVDVPRTALQRCLEVDVPVAERSVGLEELSDAVQVARSIELKHDRAAPLRVVGPGMNTE